MDYFLKASALIILFYACYKLFLQHETYFQSNRWFLLTGLFVSTVLPVVVIPIYIEYTPIPMLFSENTAFTPQQITETSSFDYWLLLPLLYIIGTLIIFSKVILQFLSLNKLFKNKKKSKQNNFVFIETEANIAPFSFFNHIVFNTKQFNQEELNLIIAHEKVHAKQFHSIDVILMQIATILFWFNPIIWLYKKALLENLEFIADYEAQNKIECSKSYQTVLLKASLHQNQLALPTNFYQSLIKKRIIMLQKSKSKNSSYFKLAIVLPFLGLFLMSFNTEEVYVATTEVYQNEKTEIFTITATSTDQQIEAIKNRLEVQTDGLKIRFSDIKRNSKGEIINLSIETKLKGKSKFNHNVTYVSKTDKPIENIALKIKNNELVFGDEKQEMVMRVTERGVIAETLKTKKEKISAATLHMQNNGDTIKMELDNENDKDENFTFVINTEQTGGEKSKLLINKKGDKPLYVLNGKIVNENEVDFDTENIASINVLKGKSAKALYGKKGENGVVEIVSKSKTVTINNTPIKASDTIQYTYSTFTIDKNGNKGEASMYDPEKTPLYVIDGKKSNRQDLSDLDPNTIKSMNVLKGKAAKQAYGTEGENGVILITTKKSSPWRETYNANAAKQNDSVKKDNPWKISHSEVNSIIYIDDKDMSKNGSTHSLSKLTPDTILESHKAYFKKRGIDLKFLTVKRNKKGEIIKLKISVDDKNGKKSKVTYQSNKGIKPVNINLNGLGEVNISSE